MVCFNPGFSWVTNGFLPPLLPMAFCNSAGRMSSSVHSQLALLQRLQTRSMFAAWLRDSAEAPTRWVQKQRSTSSRTKGKNRGPVYRSRKGEKEKAEKGKSKDAWARERWAETRQDCSAPVEEIEGLHPVINELAADCSSSSASHE